jgi:hypothetical protein
MANGEITHIRVVADLLDDVLVEVTGVALEGVANLEGVLHAREDVIGGGAEATLAQLQTLLLAIVVHVLDPGVVVGGGRVIDVVLELDDVGVGDGVGLDGAQDGRGTIVDSLDAELGGLSHSGHGEGDDAAHCDGKRSLLCFETEREREKRWSTCDSKTGTKATNKDCFSALPRHRDGMRRGEEWMDGCVGRRRMRMRRE